MGSSEAEDLGSRYQIARKEARKNKKTITFATYDYTNK